MTLREAHGIPREWKRTEYQKALHDCMFIVQKAVDWRTAAILQYCYIQKNAKYGRKSQGWKKSQAVAREGIQRAYMLGLRYRA